MKRITDLQANLFMKDYMEHPLRVPQRSTYSCKKSRADKSDGIIHGPKEVDMEIPGDIKFMIDDTINHGCVDIMNNHLKYHPEIIKYTIDGRFEYSEQYYDISIDYELNYIPSIDAITNAVVEYTPDRPDIMTDGLMEQIRSKAIECIMDYELIVKPYGYRRAISKIEYIEERIITKYRADLNAVDVFESDPDARFNVGYEPRYLCTILYPVIEVLE